jgi:hypothetical protein
MKTTEIRIGNWVDLGGMRNLYQIKDEGFGFGCLNLNPIPLTEELLVKFGLKYEEAGVYGKSGWFIKIPIQDNPTYLYFNNHLQCSLFVKINPFVFIDINTLKYVHQLQNLYFALTGEELNYKPL